MQNERLEQIFADHKIMEQYAEFREAVGKIFTKRRERRVNIQTRGQQRQQSRGGVSLAQSAWRIKVLVLGFQDF